MKTVSLILALLMMAPSFCAALGSHDGGELPCAPSGNETGRGRSVSFTNVTVAAGLGGLGGTFFTWADYDNDGDVDLLIDGWRLMRNELVPSGTATFTQAASIGGGGVWADYDNDGDLDTFGSRLWRNNGMGVLSDITATALPGYDGGFVTAAGWGDYNRDGYVDLYIARGEDWNNGNPRYFADDLWRNNGNGTFTNVTVPAGIQAVEGPNPKYGRGVEWGDYNNDEWPDIYIPNYRLTQSYLWENQGNGTFKEVAKARNVTGGGKVYGGVTYYGHSIGAAWGDIDNDGFLDLVSANLAHKDNQAPPANRGFFCDDSKVYINRGGWGCNLTDIRVDAGIPIRAVGGTAVAQDGQSYYKDELWAGSAFGDCDNDGDLDLFVPEVYDFPWGNSFLFLNNGNRTFTDVTDTAATKVFDTYGGAWADFDNDGALDLITGGKSYPGGGGELHLLKNGGAAGSYVKVNLIGTQSNRAAIGARLTASVGGSRVVREVEGGTSSHSQQNTMTQHIGLGNAAKIDTLEIKWPSGRIQFVNDIQANCTINITEATFPLPTISSLTYSPQNADEDATLTFTAMATPGAGGTIAKYFWDFTGDGTFDLNSTAQTAQYSYNRSGLYRMVARVLDTYGFAVEKALCVNVSNAVPSAKAGPDSTVNMDENVTLDGSGSTDTPSDAARGLSFLWNFGDGTYRNWSSSPLAAHVYNSTGEFNATLSLKDDDGAIGTDSALITVANVPPTVSVMADRMAYEDESVQFNCSGNDTVSDVWSLVFKWDFGDGNSTSWTAKANSSHTYVSRGAYGALLLVRDRWGLSVQGTVNITVLNPLPACTIAPEFTDQKIDEDIAVGFDGTGSDNPSDISSLHYSWYFGDGIVTDWAASTSASHVYASEGTFTVRMSVRDDDNDTGISETNITIRNPVPRAEIVTSELSASEDDRIDLDGKGTDTASDQPWLMFRWDFGDGNESAWSSESSANHSYPAAGTYKLRLTTRDDENASAKSEPLYITINNVVPVAVADASPKSVDEDAPVLFTARNSTDTPSDRSSLLYHWWFGDGDEADGMNATHVYTKSGTYSVTLRVTDNGGALSEDKELKIKVRNLAPVATATMDKAGAKTGEEFTFTGDGKDTPTDRPLLKYYWYFSDGQKVEGKVAKHSFTTAGKFTARFEVSDPEGDKGIAELSGDITAKPVVTPPKPAEGPGMAVIGAGAGAVIAVVAIVAFLAMRRKPAKPAAQSSGKGDEDGAKVEKKETIEADIKEQKASETDGKEEVAPEGISNEEKPPQADEEEEKEQAADVKEKKGTKADAEEKAPDVEKEPDA